MVSSFKKFLRLAEGLVWVSKPGTYGNAIFVIGGSGSGKNYALAKFIGAEDYKVIDADSIKEMFITKNEANPNGEERFKNFDWKNSDSVYDLHLRMKPQIDRMIRKTFSNARDGRNSTETLPNILLNTTLDRPDKLAGYVRMLVSSGYDPKKINLVWVLTDIDIALVRNRNRDRVVPETAIIDTHAGAFNLIVSMVRGLVNIPDLDGRIVMLPNSFSSDVTYYRLIGADGEATALNSKLQPTVEDVFHLVLKEPGRPIAQAASVIEKLKARLEPVRQKIEAELAANSDNPMLSNRPLTRF